MPVISRLGRLFVLPLMLVGLLATGSFTSTADAQTTPRHHHSKVHKAVKIALHQVGDRYSYGGAGPRSFDCSGLLYYSFRHAGFRHMPRTASAQAHVLHKVRKSHLRRGDLMYFHDGGDVYHAAIFLKWNRHGTAVMLDSQHPGTEVHRRHPWTNQWFGRTVRH